MSRKCESRAFSKKIRSLFSTHPDRWFSIVAAADAVECDPDRIRRQLHRAATRGELEQRYVPEGTREIVEYRRRDLLPHGRRHPVRARILRAIYVACTFTYKDIERLAGVGTNYVSKTVIPLIESGHLAVVGRQPSAYAKKPAVVYHVIDRARFRVEVMG